MQNHNILEIISISITTSQEKTWGRVYVQYKINGTLFYSFRNWMNFEEKNYFGLGYLENEPSYTWFEEKNRFEFVRYEDVLKGNADDLLLTPKEHKKKYGTPSEIAKSLLINIRANNLERVINRRGWYDRTHTEELIISPIQLNIRKKSIYFTVYETEILLEPIPFLVYWFYLEHSEGINRIDIPDYESELYAKYEKVTRSTNPEKIKKTIENLIALNSNSWDEQISKIKKVFISKLGERIASKYHIKGKKRDKYFISLISHNISDSPIHYQ